MRTPLLLLCSLLLAAPAPAQDLAAILPVDTAVTVKKLPNGLTYYLRVNRKPERRAELRLVVNAGSVLEADDQRGLAHLVEHMAFNGTKTFPRQELVSYLESIGMRFGPDLNAYTSFDETVYMLQIPTDKKPIVERGFDILEEWAHNITMEGTEIDKERGVVDPAVPEGQTRLVVADLLVSGGKPALRGERVVFTSNGPGCFLEAQAFFDDDRKLTYSCYEPEGRSSAWTIDLATGERTNQSAAIGFYNEVEGIFPDGRYACVESDHQSRAFGDPPSFRKIDVWKLRLDGTGREFTRLTTFNDHVEGWKASNPVDSSDGRHMGFQVARTAEEAGVGSGLLLLHLSASRTRAPWCDDYSE